MSENKDIASDSKKSLKSFFIKLISVSIASVIVINLIFNLIFGERLAKLDKFFNLDQSDVRGNLKDEIRTELNDALTKENILYEEDKILLYKLFQKIKKEFQDIDKSKL